jgi:ribosome-associated heat shock protein Hsp15
MDDAPDSLRVDLWLWYTRFFKTRVLAAAAVKGGHVRVNGERAKVARKIVVGDQLRVVRNQLQYGVTVLSLPRARGPAKNAVDWYLEDPGSVLEREARQQILKTDRMLAPRTPGRPDKHTRRELRGRRRDGD